jgi:uncharacterized protein
MLRRLTALVALICILGVAASPAAAGVRLALVLGNGKYEAAAPLANPANDAADVTRALRRIGFEVIEQRDATREAMVKAVQDFSERLRGVEVALFFYAGHGLQMNGENYLLPVDAKVESPADVRFNAINLNDIWHEMEGAGRTSIIILDACRNNPFVEKLSRGGRAVAARGLSRLDATSDGSLIVYSTQPDNIALEGTTRNSPFTAALLRNIGTPGLEIRQMISRVRRDVLEATAHRQTPWDSSSLVGDVYLAGSLPADASGNAQQQAASNNAPPGSIAIPEVVKECDRLTAPGQNGDPAALGVKRDWGRAVIACEAAVGAEPNEVHFEFALGKAYFLAKNYIEAARHLKTAVDAGAPDAMNALGYCFAHGLGVVKNDQRAFELYSKAAAAGSGLGMESLAGAYADGLYVKQDYGKALDWLEKSIEAGNVTALEAIGRMYFNGLGVPKDYVTAAKYYQQAADLDIGYSMRFLANMYEVGFLGQPDLEKAGALRLRAEQVDPDGRQADPISVFRRIYAADQRHVRTTTTHPVVQHRRYVIFRRHLFFGCNWIWC